ncbi:hypothetical protein RAN53_11950 [Halomonas sp. SSL-5]|uniref:hypothetical protein n=1 Tax=Halomonas sp. SSL-5 TaxID=3065855 RepID=UPI0027391E59|nr:hypothetical protein [Halomonas sp. SSL-5]MDY7117058.1 hypothetical protein [Halomonas sp. SSL-5]
MTADSETRYPDIEIYLAKAPMASLNEWLGMAIGAEPLTPVGKGKWRSSGLVGEHAIPVLLMERAADGFASLWFDSAETPWPDDAACARAAARHLGSEVRCSLGGWQPGDEPDRFLRVLPDGREEEIHWPDSGQ